MFILGLDDGANVGPFDTEEAAIRWDLKQVEADGLPEFSEKSRAVLTTWDLEKARALVVEFDHLIFEIKAVVISSHSAYGTEGREGYENMIGGSTTLINPERGI